MATHPTLFIAPTRIGDAVLATSLLAHILETDPNARVTIVTSPLSAPLFAGYPALERTIEVTKRTYNRHWLDVWRAVRNTRWHALWDVRGSILSYLLRIRHQHSYVPPRQEIPKIKQYEQALRTGPLPYPTLWPQTADTATASRLLVEGKRHLILAPIANWPPKEWPLENYIALARQLLSGPCSGYTPVIICAGHERPRALPMLQALADFSPIDLTDGTTPLLSIYACMQRANGFIGNDSGLMHMAAAAGIPTLGIFGPTPSHIYQPWGHRAAYIQAPNNDIATLSIDAVITTYLNLTADTPQIVANT